MRSSLCTRSGDYRHARPSAESPLEWVSAGTDILHSEKNDPVEYSDVHDAHADPAHVVRMWVFPDAVPSGMDRHRGDAVRFTATGGQTVTATEDAEILVWAMHAAIDGADRAEPARPFGGCPRPSAVRGDLRGFAHV
jgi:hypothetical protein